MTVHFTSLVDQSDSNQVAFTSSETRYIKTGIYARVFKRLLDIVFVLCSAPIVIPVVLILAGAIALRGGNPIYKQTRIGRDGRIFTMWKLRTMVPNAEERLKQHLETDEDARAEWETTQKLKNDPRITGFGRLLRQSSMDELPQLFNVLRGEMSLVGPRPMLPEQEKLYPGPVYYGMRPGITGLWQISERNECAFRDRAAFDLLYRRNVNFLGDIGVMAQTVRVVMRCTGY